MRNLLALVGLLVVGFAGVGWYCNWYAVKVQTGTDGKLNVSADVDQRKIGQDVGAFTEKAGKLLSSAAKSDAPAPATPTTGGTKEFVGPPAPPKLSPTAR